MNFTEDSNSMQFIERAKENKNALRSTRNLHINQKNLRTDLT